MDSNRTPTQRLFKLAGWLVAVPIVGLALLYALIVLAFLARSILGTAGVLIALVAFVGLVGFTIKKVWKG